MILSVDTIIILFGTVLVAFIHVYGFQRHINLHHNQQYTSWNEAPWAIFHLFVVLIVHTRQLIDPTETYINVFSVWQIDSFAWMITAIVTLLFLMDYPAIGERYALFQVMVALAVCVTIFATESLIFMWIVLLNALPMALLTRNSCVMTRRITLNHFIPIAVLQLLSSGFYAAGNIKSSLSPTIMLGFHMAQHVFGAFNILLTQLLCIEPERRSVHVLRTDSTEKHTYIRTQSDLRQFGHPHTRSMLSSFWELMHFLVEQLPKDSNAHTCANSRAKLASVAATLRAISPFKLPEVPNSDMFNSVEQCRAWMWQWHNLERLERGKSQFNYELYAKRWICQPKCTIRRYYEGQARLHQEHVERQKLLEQMEMDTNSGFGPNATIQLIVEPQTNHEQKRRDIPDNTDNPKRLLHKDTKREKLLSKSGRQETYASMVSVQTAHMAKKIRSNPDSLERQPLPTYSINPLFSFSIFEIRSLLKEISRSKHRQPNTEQHRLLLPYVPWKHILCVDNNATPAETLCYLQYIDNVSGVGYLPDSTHSPHVSANEQSAYMYSDSSDPIYDSTILYMRAVLSLFVAASNEQQCLVLLEDVMRALSSIGLQQITLLTNRSAKYMHNLYRVMVVDDTGRTTLSAVLSKLATVSDPHETLEEQSKTNRMIPTAFVSSSNVTTDSSRASMHKRRRAAIKKQLTRLFTLTRRTPPPQTSAETKDQQPQPTNEQKEPVVELATLQSEDNVSIQGSPKPTNARRKKTLFSPFALRTLLVLYSTRIQTRDALQWMHEMQFYLSDARVRLSIEEFIRVYMPPRIMKKKILFDKLNAMHAQWAYINSPEGDRRLEVVPNPAPPKQIHTMVVESSDDGNTTADDYETHLRRQQTYSQPKHHHKPSTQTVDNKALVRHYINCLNSQSSLFANVLQEPSLLKVQEMVETFILDVQPAALAFGVSIQNPNLQFSDVHTRVNVIEAMEMVLRNLRILPHLASISPYCVSLSDVLDNSKRTRSAQLGMDTSTLANIRNQHEANSTTNQPNFYHDYYSFLLLVFVFRGLLLHNSFREVEQYIWECCECVVMTEWVVTNGTMDIVGHNVVHTRSSLSQIQRLVRIKFKYKEYAVDTRKQLKQPNSAMRCVEPALSPLASSSSTSPSLTHTHGPTPTPSNSLSAGSHSVRGTVGTPHNSIKSAATPTTDTEHVHANLTVEVKDPAHSADIDDVVHKKLLTYMPPKPIESVDAGFVYKPPSRELTAALLSSTMVSETTIEIVALALEACQRGAIFLDRLLATQFQDRLKSDEQRRQLMKECRGFVEGDADLSDLSDVLEVPYCCNMHEYLTAVGYGRNTNHELTMGVQCAVLAAISQPSLRLERKQISAKQFLKEHLTYRFRCFLRQWFMYGLYTVNVVNWNLSTILECQLFRPAVRVIDLQRCLQILQRELSEKKASGFLQPHTQGNRYRFSRTWTVSTFNDQPTYHRWTKEDEECLYRWIEILQRFVTTSSDQIKMQIALLTVTTSKFLQRYCHELVHTHQSIETTLASADCHGPSSRLSMIVDPKAEDDRSSVSSRRAASGDMDNESELSDSHHASNGRQEWIHEAVRQEEIKSKHIGTNQQTKGRRKQPAPPPESTTRAPHQTKTQAQSITFSQTVLPSSTNTIQINNYAPPEKHQFRADVETDSEPSEPPQDYPDEAGDNTSGLDSPREDGADSEDADREYGSDNGDSTGLGFVRSIKEVYHNIQSRIQSRRTSIDKQQQSTSKKPSRAPTRLFTSRTTKTQLPNSTSNHSSAQFMEQVSSKLNKLVAETQQPSKSRQPTTTLSISPIARSPKPK